jgi:hypothetical protein
MDVVCTFFGLTFYPAPYPSVASPIVLLAPGELIDAASPIVADLAQLVDVQTGVRWETPNIFTRGNKTLRLQWDEVKKFDSPGAALAATLERQEAMPSATGWVMLEIPTEGRAWAVQPVAFRSHGSSFQLGNKSYRQRWDLASGSLTEIATSAEDGAITTETGVEILTEDGGFYLALES